jgi:hypothetical protein
MTSESFGIRFDIGTGRLYQCPGISKELDQRRSICDQCREYTGISGEIYAFPDSRESYGCRQTLQAENIAGNGSRILRKSWHLFFKIVSHNQTAMDHCDGRSNGISRRFVKPMTNKFEWIRHSNPPRGGLQIVNDLLGVRRYRFTFRNQGFNVGNRYAGEAVRLRGCDESFHAGNEFLNCFRFCGNISE